MSDADLPGLGPRGGVPKIAAPVDGSRVLVDLSAAPVAVGVGAQGGGGPPGDRPFALDDERGYLLSLIDGRTTVHQILLLAPFPQAKTVALLREMFARRVIDIS